LSRQKLGQHFLQSAPVLARIATALQAQPGDRVLEIGPGKGALTRLLLQAGLTVEAVEVDPAMVAHLEAAFPSSAFPLSVHCQDVLQADLSRWGPVIVAGNLPYYITSPILKALFAMGPNLRRAVLLMQLEVAQRLVAEPGSRDYGYLTVLTRLHAQPEMLFRVPPGAFHIPPKVQSAVVRLHPLNPEDSLLDGTATDVRFLHFLSLCFSQKRKTLRNNLRGTYPADRLVTDQDAAKRAEQLSLAELHGMFRRMEHPNALAG
jgi:16S rRNA (adenine1518-N6/adenine1519-N6)-dimethyltransferase